MHRYRGLVIALTAVFAVGCGGKKGSSLPESKYIKESNKAIALIDVAKLQASELSQNPALGGPGGPLGEMPVKPEHIERVIAAGDPATFGNAIPSFVATIKLTGDADMAAVKKKIEELPEQTAGSIKYRGGGANQPSIYLDESAKIVVLGTEDALKEALGSGASNSALLDKVAANIKHAVYVHADVSAGREQMAQAAGMAGPAGAALASAAKSLDAISLTMDVDGSTLLDLSLEAADSDGAKIINDAIAPLIGLAKMGLQGAPSEGPQKASMDFAKEIMDGTELTQSGNTVNLTIAMPKDFASRVKDLMPPMGPGGPGGPGGDFKGGPGGDFKGGPGGDFKGGDFKKGDFKKGDFNGDFKKVEKALEKGAKK